MPAGAAPGQSDHRACRHPPRDGLPGLCRASSALPLVFVLLILPSHTGHLASPCTLARANAHPASVHSPCSGAAAAECLCCCVQPVMLQPTGLPVAPTSTVSSSHARRVKARHVHITYTAPQHPEHLLRDLQLQRVVALCPQPERGIHFLAWSVDSDVHSQGGGKVRLWAQCTPERQHRLSTWSTLFPGAVIQPLRTQDWISTLLHRAQLPGLSCSPATVRGINQHCCLDMSAHVVQHLACSAATSWVARRLHSAVHGAPTTCSVYNPDPLLSAAATALGKRKAPASACLPLADRVRLGEHAQHALGDRWLALRRPAPIANGLLPPNMPPGGRNLSTTTAPCKTAPSVAKQLLAHLNRVGPSHGRVLQLSVQNLSDLHLSALDLRTGDYVADRMYVFVLQSSIQTHVVRCKRPCLSNGQGLVFAPLRPAKPLGTGPEPHHRDQDKHPSPRSGAAKLQHCPPVPGDRHITAPDCQPQLTHPGPVLGADLQHLRTLCKPAVKRASSTSTLSRHHKMCALPMPQPQVAVGTGYDVTAFYRCTAPRRPTSSTGE